MILTLAVLNRFLTTNILSLVLIFSIFLGLWDMYPKLTSQVNERFGLKYKNPLKSEFWIEMSSCYDKVVSVPPVTTAELLYPIAKVAYRQNMTIFPAYIPRVPTQEQLARQTDLRKSMRLGNFQDTSIYIFQSAKFVDESITNLDKFISINTMSPTSRAGTINNFFVVAPNFENCHSLFTKYSHRLNIIKQDNFLVNKNINFANNLQSQKLLISGWSEIEPWGVWSNDNESEILLQFAASEEVQAIEFLGHRYIDSSGQGPKMEVFVNEKRKALFEKSSDKIESITIYLTEEERQNKNYLIKFRFSNLVSPLDDNGSPDSRKLGYGLKSIQLK